MKIVYSGSCDPGLKREVNQDSIVMFFEPKNQVALFAVADGMGGHSHGEQASHWISSGLKKWMDVFSPERYECSFAKMMRALQDKLEELNKEIFFQYNQNQVCGTTCVLLFIYRDSYGVINVGDSRAYHKQGRKVRVLTVDDVWENQRSIREHFSEREIAVHPNRGKLVQAMGTKEKIALSVKTDSLHQEEVFLLCSDGLYKYCPEKYYKKTVKGLSEKNMEEAAKKLMAKVYENGAGDNASFILIKYIR
ncbi:MAG: serine/threonine-protein phosphatase [Lachnospiraceae bacterium]|nr:serine/threonine-protein phosphatase [Lachnospiraceae bacterium]